MLKANCKCVGILILVSLSGCSAPHQVPYVPPQHPPRDLATSQALIDAALLLEEPVSILELKEQLGAPDDMGETLQPINWIKLSTTLEYILAEGEYTWVDGEKVKLAPQGKILFEFGQEDQLALMFPIKEPLKSAGSAHWVDKEMGEKSRQWEEEREQEKRKREQNLKSCCFNPF